MTDREFRVKTASGLIAHHVLLVELTVAMADAVAASGKQSREQFVDNLVTSGERSLNATGLVDELKDKAKADYTVLLDDVAASLRGGMGQPVTVD